MSDFLEKAMSQTDPWVDARIALEKYWDKFPHFCKVLGGEPKKGDKLGIVPGSIRLFVNGTDLKAQLTGREWLYDGYVMVPKELGIIEGIESELKAGRIGWSTSTGQKNSTKVPAF